MIDYKSPIVSLSIIGMKKIKPIEILNLHSFEEEHAQKEIVNPKAHKDSIINLTMHRKRKLYKN